MPYPSGEIIKPQMLPLIYERRSLSSSVLVSLENGEESWITWIRLRKFQLQRWRWPLGSFCDSLLHNNTLGKVSLPGTPYLPVEGQTPYGRVTQLAQGREGHQSPNTIQPPTPISTKTLFPQLILLSPLPRDTLLVCVFVMTCDYVCSFVYNIRGTVIICPLCNSFMYLSILLFHLILFYIFIFLCFLLFFLCVHCCHVSLGS